MIEADVVDAMVALPGQLFYSTQIPACLWILAKDKSKDGHRERRGEFLFIDARKLGFMADRTRRELSDADIAKIADVYHRWRNKREMNEKLGFSDYTDEPGFCKAATLAEVGEHGHVLTPGRYVGAADEDDDGVIFEDQVGKFRTRLTDQFAEGRRLERLIVTQLGMLTRDGD